MDMDRADLSGGDARQISADEALYLAVLARRTDRETLEAWAWRMLELGSDSPSLAALTSARGMVVGSELDLLVEAAIAETGLPTLPAEDDAEYRAALLPILLDWQAGRRSAREAFDAIRAARAPGPDTGVEFQGLAEDLDLMRALSGTADWSAFEEEFASVATELLAKCSPIWRVPASPAVRSR